MLDDLYIRCKNRDKGCEAVVLLENLESHENMCPQIELLALRAENDQLMTRISIKERRCKCSSKNISRHSLDYARTTEVSNRLVYSTKLLPPPFFNLEFFPSCS